MTDGRLDQLGSKLIRQFNLVFTSCFLSQLHVKSRHCLPNLPPLRPEVSSVIIDDA